MTTGAWQVPRFPLSHSSRSLPPQGEGEARRGGGWRWTEPAGDVSSQGRGARQFPENGPQSRPGSGSAAEDVVALRLSFPTC